MTDKNSQASIQQDFNGLTISIPQKINYFIVLFTCLWLIAWAYFEYNAVINFINSNYQLDSFYSVWLLIWTAGGISTIKSLVKMLFDKERLTIKDQQLIIKHSTMSLDKAQNIATHQISEIKLNAFDGHIDQQPLGKILILHADQTSSFAESISKDEALHLIQIINQKLQRRTTNPTADYSQYNTKF